ncbi:CAP-Gly domain-containing linker protein 1-like [Mercenaria mercenaria]|uniref:CAP-Gly domain-containing linker protein 1-like n=1 Tax=Mercenaria mercenaria TaxID=6596 RepID=UPI00234ED7E1|nr:CAP-Gly domain-containing linker protein 1-like [Mercenaria mercenaria]XP_045173595.2 CAP-Gly domain-containing linker protein 1-like [Mercenaria mercenaria]
MMSHFNEDSENSDYCSVTGDESAVQESVPTADLQKLEVSKNQLLYDITNLRGIVCDYKVKNKRLIRKNKSERDTWIDEERRFREIISDKNAEIKDLQSKVKRLEIKHKDLTEQYNVLSSTRHKGVYERQNRELSESKAEIEKSKAEIQESKAEIEKLKEKILLLEKALKEKDETICEKVTTEMKAVVQNNQDEMMKKLTETQRAYEDKLDKVHENMMNVITEKDRLNKEMMTEMAEKDRAHKEQMFDMFKTFAEKLESNKSTSEQQMPSFERRSQRFFNGTDREHEKTYEIQSNYFVSRFGQLPYEHLETNMETTEIQELNLLQRPESLPGHLVSMKKDVDGQKSVVDEKSEKVPSGKIVKNNNSTKKNPTLVTKSAQSHYVTVQQQGTSLERDAHYFPNIRRQRCLKWCSPNAPWKYPQGKT